MRPIVVLALAACALVAAAAARGISIPPIPESTNPAWLDAGTIRFESNFEWRRTGDFRRVPYVMAADGSTPARPATDAEALQPPASPPQGETLEFGAPSSAGEPLFLVDAKGHHRLLEAAAYNVGAALSPDGRTAIFAAWVGQHNADSVVLYAIPTDGSSEPRRLTPTSCTRAGGGPLGGSCFDGTDGPDKFVGTKRGDLVIAGSGDDTIRAGDGQNMIQSQWGRDDIRSGSGVDTVWAGAGNDVIRTGAARDLIYLGPGRDRVVAGAGPDVVVANDGERDVIECGAGDDRARIDRVDMARNCEHIRVAPPEPAAPPR